MKTKDEQIEILIQMVDVLMDCLTGVVDRANDASERINRITASDCGWYDTLTVLNQVVGNTLSTIKEVKQLSEELRS